MSDLREAYERINRVMKSTTDKVARRDLREIAGLLTALSAQPQPETVEAVAVDPSSSMRKIVSEAMTDAWNTICADTGCHPLDIDRVRGQLYFKPGHWAEQTAMLLTARTVREKIVTPPLAPDERMRSALDKEVYYLESILRQLREYKDFVGSCETLTPSIGGEVLADNLDWLDCHIEQLKRSEALSGAADASNAAPSRLDAGGDARDRG